MQNHFDEIRPYHDEEVNAAIQNLVNDPEFIVFARYLLSGFNRMVFTKEMEKINDIAGFQKNFVVRALDVVISRSMKTLGCSGIEKLNKHTPYLFISNHRDIVLDSSFINLLLFRHGHATSQIAIGGNLLISPMITNLVRINKSFIVKRNLPARQMLEYSMLLSSYISYVIHERKESVWIAQRQGRAKDGNDKTQYGLLKMLVMHDEKNFREVFFNLPIVPVALSYEYDPCDVLKAIELYHKDNKMDFVKTPAEDYKSMIKGILEYKGNVHVAFGNLLNSRAFDDKTAGINDWLKNAASCIDRNIHCGYKLWKPNFIAYDVLNGKTGNKELYSDSEREAFIKYISGKVKKEAAEYPEKEMINIILAMYANPVKNQLALKGN
ncbi:MAG: 1-acyl-sn-glycerol-3-phosphate acyltransferase [Bacteroidales bacterium]|jgi:hypothetical protein|nr:1-acyl-sn-glycerol-3-phosphate acyltransferase [Bacteroidales bacterium]MDD4213961.1 1-acyl-sn-glycerol-3-phosphate acyltransferase [Bacteroidales bacterium]